ncbi:MAG: NAD-dependent epimerase/dehydratase family protein, partial [Alphaproteobacteria bacterium]
MRRAVARAYKSSERSEHTMYLVTGGAGFIGSNLVAALAARGEVVVNDILDDSNRANLAKRGDLTVICPDELPGWLASGGTNPEAIFHMGAISSTVERDVDRIMQNNYLLSLRLWHWAAEHRVPFIYASSAATYGGGELGFDDDNS